jgi:hypothetical protein
MSMVNIALKCWWTVLKWLKFAAFCFTARDLLLKLFFMNKENFDLLISGFEKLKEEILGFKSMLIDVVANGKAFEEQHVALKTEASIRFPLVEKRLDNIEEAVPVDNSLLRFDPSQHSVV